MTYGKSNKQYVGVISFADDSKSPLPESDDDVAEEISSRTSCEWSYSEDEDDFQVLGDEESKSPPLDSDDDFAEEISSPSYCEWSYSEDEEDFQVGGNENWDVNDVDKPDAESMCNKVIQFLRGKNDLQELKVDECKAYLRMHRLRLSGTKEECIERIKEHWKLKDQNGEVFYPRSSFIVDCTGDVCKGDVVLFHQKVHQRSGTTARNKTVGRRNVGRRTVAGRVIKESYGATRQQHTFTVEVLWSTGTKKLKPLFPLLVKGRNLYKMRTFRQLWKNEKERLEVLAEKHRRGNDARTVRAVRRTEAAMRKNESSSSALKGTQHFKRFHDLGPSRTRERSPGRKNYPNARGKMAKNNEGIHSHRFAPYSSKGNVGSIPHRSYHNSPDYGRHSPALSHKAFKSDVFPAEPLGNYHYIGYNEFAPTDGSPYSRPLPHSSTRPSSKWNETIPAKYHYIGYNEFASIDGSPYTHPLPYSRWKETGDGSSRGPSYSHSKNENDSVEDFNYSRSRGSHHSSYSTTRRRRRR